MFDADPAPGRFLLTGSASPRTTTSFRCRPDPTARLRPLTLLERGVAHPTVSLRELLSGSRPPPRGRGTIARGPVDADWLNSLADRHPLAIHAGEAGSRTARDAIRERLLRWKGAGIEPTGPTG